MKSALLFLFTLLSLSTQAQNLVQGIIKNSETNQAIEYVIVIANQSGKTTVSNSEGRFQIQLTPNDTKVIFKHLDFFTQEVTVKNNKNIYISMNPSAESLDEVVILSTSIKDEINKAIKTSQANFSKDLKLNTFYRELLYINGTMYQYEDAEIDYYLKSINKSNVIVNGSRSVKFSNGEAKKFDSLTNVHYYWGDLRERVSNEFDFKLIKDIINDKEYDLYITSKTAVDGTELHILNFNPIDNAKNATLSGTVTYGSKDYLIREVKANLAEKFISSNNFIQQNNHRFKRSFYNRTTIFNIYDNKYSLTYTSYRIFGVSQVANQLTKVGGFVELLVDSIDENPTKPNTNDFYTDIKLTRLGKNYKTKYWQKFNVVPLTFKEEQMLKQINE